MQFSQNPCCLSDVIVVDVTACVADIAFVIDNSGSIRDNDPPGGNNWQLILNFVKSIIDVFDVAQDATRFAAIDFGMKMKTKFTTSIKERWSNTVASDKRID